MAKKNIEADNLNILPIWAGAIDIIEENNVKFLQIVEAKEYDDFLK